MSEDLNVYAFKKEKKAKPFFSCTKTQECELILYVRQQRLIPKPAGNGVEYFQKCQVKAIHMESDGTSGL